ncbi:MAG TPA: hypothetical protein VMN79_02950 [Casimicrobiaceae bacterium]|nr:hypothetical protein [Casimicrobiaceae bacterium]
MSGRPSCALAAALLVCACATSEDRYRLDQPRSGAGVELPPYGMREECFTLEADDRIDFYFASTAAVAFNIHYHDANAVIMPIERQRTKAESGDFVADRRQVYCMMWEAGAEPAMIDYRIRPLPKR